MMVQKRIINKDGIDEFVALNASEAAVFAVYQRACEKVKHITDKATRDGAKAELDKMVVNVLHTNIVKDNFSTLFFSLDVAPVKRYWKGYWKKSDD